MGVAQLVRARDCGSRCRGFDPRHPPHFFENYYLYKRGLWYNYLRAKAEYAFNKDICAYFLAEYFIQGDFYVKTADDALFLRTELSVKF